MAKKSTMAIQMEKKTIRDTGVATTIAACGYTPILEERGGIVYFIFTGDPHVFAEIEDGYWNGGLKVSAKKMMQMHKELKDRLYDYKRSAGLKS